MPAGPGTESYNKPGNQNIYSVGSFLKFGAFSLFGILLFFTPLTVNGARSIPLDHLITFINKIVPMCAPVVALCIVLAGGIAPWIQGTYRRDILSFILSVFRTLGIPVAAIGFLNYTHISNIGPEALTKPDMIPVLFEKVLMVISLVVPIGSLFLTFIICFGFLEFTGLLVKFIMRPLYRVPGKAAIDAVASFVGSFSIAIFLTNRLYKEGKYTAREAIIIMSGFSTASATFMVVIAKTAGMMYMWNFYFLSTLIVTFVVTAITVRIWPINKIDNSYIDGVGKPEIDAPGNLIVNALKEGLRTAAGSKPLLPALWENLKDGIKMTLILVPCAASLGLLAFILVKMTSVFDIVAYIFAPFTFVLALFGLPQPMMVAKASAVVLGEMFVPNLLVASFPMGVKYVVGVVSVSAILFFGGSIPCLLSVDVNFRPWQMIVIWFERTVLSIIFAGIIAVIMF